MLHYPFINVKNYAKVVGGVLPQDSPIFGTYGLEILLSPQQRAKQKRMGTRDNRLHKEEPARPQTVPV